MSYMSGCKQVRAIGYVRTSSAVQSSGENSLDAQLNSIKDYCLRRGYSLVEMIEDRGFSSLNLRRHGMMKIVSSFFSEGSKPDVIVVRDLSRLCRSVTHLKQLLSMFRCVGVEVESIP